MTAPVCFVDTETTSLHPTEGEIYEVGLILPDGAEQHWWLPVSLEHADEMALRVGRYHERHPHGNGYPHPCCQPSTSKESRIHFSDHRAYPLNRFAPDFARLTHGLHLAGAVVSFDALRLDRLLRSQGVLPSWHYHLIDVEALAVGYIHGERATVCSLGDPEADGISESDFELVRALPWDSKVLTRLVGVDLDQFTAHEALEDARWAKAVYEAVMG